MTFLICDLLLPYAGKNINFVMAKNLYLLKKYMQCIYGGFTKPLATAALIPCKTHLTQLTRILPVRLLPVSQCGA